MEAFRINILYIHGIFWEDDKHLSCFFFLW